MTDLTARAVAAIARLNNDREVIVAADGNFELRSAPDHYGQTYTFRAYYLAKDDDGEDILVDVGSDSDAIAAYL